MKSAGGNYVTPEEMTTLNKRFIFTTSLPNMGKWGFAKK
jgi:hypothetical protein